MPFGAVAIDMPVLKHRSIGSIDKYWWEGGSLWLEYDVKGNQAFTDNWNARFKGIFFMWIGHVFHPNNLFSVSLSLGSSLTFAHRVGSIGALAHFQLGPGPWAQQKPLPDLGRGASPAGWCCL